MEHENKLNNQVFISILLGTLFWGGYGFALSQLMPEHLFDYKSWALVIGIDIICMIYYLIFRHAINAIDCFTKVITLIQISYCMHLYNLHIIYLFSMVGLFSVTLPTFVSSKSKYIYIYAISAMICGLSYTFISYEHSILIGIGCVLGPLFSAILTITNKKIRDENLKMKVELKEASKYAHEINNPMVIIKATVDMMLVKEGSLDQKDKDMIKKASTHIDRITGVLKEARDRFSTDEDTI